jgi:hypothetical protein
MRNRSFDRTRPDKTKIAVPGLHRQARDWHRLDARPVAIQLVRSEPIRISLAARDDFGL